nr:hypothetical protein [Tanacetum cinerariifolium]
APVARIEAIRLFLAYASFKDVIVYQMDVKSAFLYGKIEEEVYVCQPLRFKDLDFPDKVYKVKKALYNFHDDEDAFGAEADFYNLDSTFQVSPIPTTRIYKDHPIEQVIRDLHLAPHTRRMSKNLEKHGREKERINYQPVVAQSNDFLGTKASNDAGKEKEPDRYYILLTLWTADSPFSTTSKSSQDNEFQPSNDGAKRVDEDLSNENERNAQGEEDSTNSTNRVNTVTLNINAASSSGVNVVGTNISIDLPPDPNMPSLEDIGIFEDFHDDEDAFGAEADFYNLDSTFQVSPIPTTRIYKDHPIEQVIRDLHLAPHTKRMSKNLEKHGLVGTVIPRTDNKDLQNCLFACLLSQLEPKKAQNGFFRNKMEERGIVIGNKARLVAQGNTQEEGIDYDEVFAPVSRIEAIRLFLAYASFKDVIVYQMDMKSAFLYGKIEEEVYVCQPLGFKDLDFPDKVYKVKKALYSLHQAVRAWPDIMFVVCACARYQVTPKVSHLHAVKRIVRYLKGQPKLGLWYPKDSSFDLVAYTDSGYAGASLDRKSTTGGCQFLGCRLISWQCKKQTVVGNSTTKAEYVAGSSCCG